jgi:hypothetical protein
MSFIKEYIKNRQNNCFENFVFIRKPYIMKLFKTLTAISLFFFFSGTLLGQSLTYSAAEDLLSGDQSDRLEKAEKYLGNGETDLNKAKEIEKKYEKKKKKQKKYDKKTWEAKKYRIFAEKDFLKAYKEACEVYSEVISQAEFFDEDDIQEANSLNEEALALIEEAESDMKSYNSMANDKGELKKLSASKLNSALGKSKNKRESAYDKQKEALDLVLAQGRKKAENERDDAAWSQAQSIHTIAGYQDYIDNFPSGKYVNKARQLINQLREEEERNKTAVSDYTFMIQIATSTHNLSNWELKRLYSNTSEIKSEYIDGIYKYRVDKSFTTYEQAYNFALTLKNKNPDLFIVAFSKSGNQIQVTEEMKPDHLKGKTPTMY